MHIELHIPRPGTALLAVAAVSGWALYFHPAADQAAAVIEASPMQTTELASPVDAVMPAPAEEITDLDELLAARGPGNPMNEEELTGLTQAEIRMKRARAEQDFLRQRDAIIRDQLKSLQKEREVLGPNVDPAIEEQFRQSVRLITSLARYRQKAEQFLLMSYRQEWESEERAMVAATGAPKKKVSLFWPIEPKIGISAYFLDEGYKERFKVEHYAIDIPVEQGTVVLAAAPGIVKDVVNHGLGYNYVTVDHGGYATVYGHLSQFNVRAGERLRAGSKIGLSGGMPGLPGGGLSTGPHLHFGLYVKGVPVDPLKYLPKYRG